MESEDGWYWWCDDDFETKNNDIPGLKSPESIWECVMDNKRQTDTIVLIHGFWLTPRSWEHWISHYEARGYQVLVPAYPGLEVEVEALNADPTPVERLTVPAIIAHLESIVAALDAPPILMGHSAGGTFVQILLDYGFGAAGVTFNSAPTEGVLVAPWSQIRATFPVLKSPANRHRAVGLTYEQWRYAFANTFPETEARALYKRYHVPASGGILWDSVLANLEPGPQATWVNYRNPARPPLLFISGGEDHLMPPVVQHSNAAHYKAETLTEVTVFEGALSSAPRAGRLAGNRRLRAVLGRAAHGHSRRARILLIHEPNCQERLQRKVTSWTDATPGAIGFPLPTGPMIAFPVCSTHPSLFPPIGPAAVSPSLTVEPRAALNEDRSY